MKILILLVVKFSVYLNRHVFVMLLLFRFCIIPESYSIIKQMSVGVDYKIVFRVPNVIERSMTRLSRYYNKMSLSH